MNIFDPLIKEIHLKLLNYYQQDEFKRNNLKHRQI